VTAPGDPVGVFLGATASLNGHETGNGGNSQGEPKATRNLLYSEVHSRNGFPVIRKKRAPALGRLGVSRRPLHPAGDGSLGDIEAQHEQFAVNARRAPGWCWENPSWGAPRIHGELLKLGIDIGESSVSKYMVRCRKPPSQTWCTFLQNHTQQLVSIDFFTVPTLRFQVLYVFLVLAHDRRRILHCNVTAHPTAEWTGQQLREAFPFDQPPRYLLRDRDAIFGDAFRGQVRDMGIQEVLGSPRSPWQRAYLERVIGSIRRECLDHGVLQEHTDKEFTMN
jgi:transposase InsO family protein